MQKPTLSLAKPLCSPRMFVDERGCVRWICVICGATQ